MCTDIIASPFWAGVTDAYTKRDLVWIKSTLKKLEQVMILFIPIIIIMILCTDFVVAVWVGNDVSIPFSLTIATGIFVYFQSTYCIYSNLVNGTGYIRPQLTVFVFFCMHFCTCHDILCTCIWIMGKYYITNHYICCTNDSVLYTNS